MGKLVNGRTSIFVANGSDELAVTNGHIGDFGAGQPPPAPSFQLFRKSDVGSFELVRTRTTDGYLSTNHIGRAMWKIDVDRDLADDLVITHQDSPPALLANRTETPYQRVSFSLVGTQDSRDAIGSCIEYVVGGRARKMWLTSGDGYMCSSERVLKAGIGSSHQVTDVVVVWPTGNRESFGTLDAGAIHLLVQETGNSFTLQSSVRDSVESPLPLQG